MRTIIKFVVIVGFFMSNTSNISDRFTKIRELRDQLCSGSKSKSEVEAVRQEFLSAMQELSEFANDDKCSVQDIRLKISEILKSLVTSHGIENVK